MSRKHKKQHTLARVATPGGATMFIPAGQLQSLFAQTFYGNKPQIPTQDATMFSPGVPLAPQPGVNKGGLPVQYKFPIAYNSFPVDRSQGQPDIPSFQQLRQLAKLYSGITLCERAWFDMVPRMQVKVNLHPDYVAQGAEEKDYQKEISYFRKWFEKPDGRRDIHTWLRMCLREQTQIDELYWYKHRTRGGKLLSLHVVAGDTMKPLLNDWGDIPIPSDPDPYAYQQYPWGIPGMQYTTDMMMHYQESPAADTPYGQSRIERIIMEVNQALRKKRRDLAMFTEGNIPQGIMEVPDAPQWTPDMIDAYEQSWNALLAGNSQQQVRVKFTQPGMKYIKTDSGEILTDFDLFLLNIACGIYGVSLQDIGVTGDIHKSADDGQQNMLYRRTIDPLAMIYGWQLTSIMQHDFDPSLHGDMFILSFGGFEEAEDLGSLATAYSTLTNAGILGLTNAGKLMKLPEDPDAPHIGRVFMTQTGPIFLDDMASDTMRKAQQAAQLAGFKLAANPPKPQQPNENDPQSQQSGGTQKGTAQSDDEDEEDAGQQARALVRHLPGKHDQKEHGVWAAHKGKGGTHIEKFADSLQKKAASFTAMADRKLSAHWTAEDAATANKIADDLRKIASTLYANPHADIHSLMQDMQSSAQALHQMNPHAMSEHRIEVLQKTQEQAEQASELDGKPAKTHSASHHKRALDGERTQELASADYKRWRQRAIEDVRDGKSQRPFFTTEIPPKIHNFISQLLSACQTPDEVRATFARAQTSELDLLNAEQTLDYNNSLGVWEPEDAVQQLQGMLDRGIQFLRWRSTSSASGVCPVCGQNDGLVRRVGETFPSGHRIPQCHPHCGCEVEQFFEKPEERA